VKRAATAAFTAAALLLFAAPAQAIKCEDVFSKIDQADPLAPFVVGDSVTVPAGEFLGEKGFAVNAVACRTFAQGLEVMSGRPLPDLVVVALGSNAAVSSAELEAALDLVGPFARLMLVLPKELGGSPDPDGRLMRAFAEAHPDQVTIVDWPAYSAGHGDWFAPDGLHLTTDGALGFAQMITEAVEFAPVEPAEPLDRAQKEQSQRRGRPQVPVESTESAFVSSLLGTLGDVVTAVLSPGLRLLAAVLGDAATTAQPDL
jgi:hypothetical protein